MNTNIKGSIAEQKVILRALEKGLLPSKPVSPTRYDLLLDQDGEIKKTQVKYGDGKSKNQFTVTIQLRSWCNGQYKIYTSREIDIILVYIPKVDKIICLKPEHFEGKREISVRLDKRYGKNSNFIEDLIW